MTQDNGVLWDTYLELVKYDRVDELSKQERAHRKKNAVKRQQDNLGGREVFLNQDDLLKSSRFLRG